MSGVREPYIVGGQEVEPEVGYLSVSPEDVARFGPVRFVTHPDPDDLAVIERRHLRRLIARLAAVYAAAPDPDLALIITALTEGNWKAL